MKLSICIPAYNRARLLKETLDSILSQVTDEVEITVSDNGSTDDTPEVVAHYQTLFPRLIYDRFSENQGADRCYLRCVEIATGEYCWLMGSDDCIEPGGIARVLAALKEHPDLTGISVNYLPYDATFSSVILESPLPFFTDLPKFTVDKQINSFEDFFPFPSIYTGYLSGQIVKKARWQEVVANYPVEKFFKAYSLVYVIHQMVKKHPKWLCISQKCVGYRTDNDSFMDQGAFHRLKIDVCSLDEIFREFFSLRDPIYLHLKDFLVRNFITVRLLRANLVSVEKGFWKQAFFLCARFYAKRAVFWSHLLPFFIIPSWMWKFMRWVYRKTWKRYRYVSCQ